MSDKSAKKPSMQFYPGDWRKDPGVQSLSYFDRGVWFEILCLMFESEQRGKLLLNGKPMPDEALSRLLGLDKQILTKTLTTLLDYGVAIRDEQGALANRRMIRDEKLSEIRRAAGAKGGNPNLVNQNPNQTESKTPKQAKQNPTPSSSSSTTISSNEENSSSSLPAKPPPLTESHENYLARKQREYPNFDIAAIYKKFRSLCGSEKYPHLSATRKQFDKWLETEEEELPPVEENGSSPPAWKIAIDNCALCDERGFRQENGKTVKCRHAVAEVTG